MPALTPPVQAPVVPAAVQVSAVKVAAAAPSVVAARPASVTVAVKAAPRKMQAVAMLDRGLLSDSTLGDLVSGARSEARRLR